MAGGFFLAGSALPNDAILHPSGYDGSGGVARVTFCVDPDSPFAEEMNTVAPALEATFDAFTPASPNIVAGGANNVPPTSFDWQSAALHELGHCLGLADVNLADTLGVAQADWNYTRSRRGGNGFFNLLPGTDGIKGSLDDLRGDDVNLNWFHKPTNNPFVLDATIDTTTYSQSPGDLPGGSAYIANGNRDVAADLGLADTEAVMVHGLFLDEARRELGHDDIATLRLGMAGLDETQGTADDYTINLDYVGITDDCDLPIRVGPGTDFANCQAGITEVTVGSGGLHHWRIGGQSSGSTAPIVFSDAIEWFYNLPTIPDLCPPTPRVDCRQTAAKKSGLLIKDSDLAGRDLLKFKWNKGEATDLADFLDPIGGDATWSFCVYDSSMASQPLVDAGVNSGGNCGAKPCWGAKADKGYQYRSRSGFPEGISQVKLQTGIADKAKIQIKASGDYLASPAPALTFPVTVQVVADDGVTDLCWGVEFEEALKNEAGLLKAKGPVAP